MTSNSPIRIGGASGFWGDAALATPQLLAGASLNYIVYDYLAEVTLSIMARARAADGSKGYATDFVTAAMAPNLEEIAAQGVRVVSNAGGVNPQACADALRALVDEKGLALRVAVVEGDDLLPRASEFLSAREMFSDEPFPDLDRIASINAYLGAFPIAAALDAGADIVVTGRCVDSAVTLGACIHAFAWQPEDLDKLAQGSLAGHLLECGTQATGGNYTDWESIAESLPSAGYPIAEVAADGFFRISKPEGTGGTVTVGSVAEQMLYEIGDSAAYELPDVSCDFSHVQIEQESTDVVAVSGARGLKAPDDYKVSATWADGYRAGQLWTMVGRDAERKARCFADGVFERTAQVLAQRGLPPLGERSVEVLGAETHFGAAGVDRGGREVDVKIAVKHPNAAGIGVFLKEMIGLALTAPPGLCGFAGARPKPTPVVRLFSFLIAKDRVPVSVTLDGQHVAVTAGEVASPAAPASQTRERAEGHEPPPVPAGDGDDDGGEGIDVPLEWLAFARSGDKGDKANVGVIARKIEFLPYIAAELTADRVAAVFAHFLEASQARPVERFYLPGTAALNFLLHRVLGGGGTASLRADPQGKCYAQVLLGETISVPQSFARLHGLVSQDDPTEERSAQ